MKVSPLLLMGVSLWPCLCPADSAAAGQELTVRVEPEVALPGTPGGKLLIEPHLAAHPLDPARLLVAVIATEPDYSEQFCLISASADAGRTWSSSRLGIEGCGDPWLTWTGDRAVLTTLSPHPHRADGPEELLVLTTRDGGLSWSERPEALGSGQDGPRSVAGPDGEVYLTSGSGWTDEQGRRRYGALVGVLRHGSSAVDVTQRRYALTNLNQNVEGALVLPDGGLLMTYQDFQRPVGGAERAFRGRAGALERRRVWAAVSHDAGATFGVHAMVTESCFGRPTFLAQDRSGGVHDGLLYHVCPGEMLGSVLVTTSSDGGWEWSEPVAIEAPAAGFGARNFPVLAVNNAGVLAVAWMDRRDGPEQRCYTPYLALSADGGGTFSDPVPLSSEASCPDLEAMGRAGGRFPTGGDYFGLAAAADGRFHVVWPDARSGRFTLWATAVSVELSRGSAPG